jgi:hypothetical protein
MLHAAMHPPLLVVPVVPVVVPPPPDVVTVVLLPVLPPPDVVAALAPVPVVPFPVPVVDVGNPPTPVASVVSLLPAQAMNSPVLRKVTATKVTVACFTVLWRQYASPARFTTKFVEDSPPI